MLLKNKTNKTAFREIGGFFVSFFLGANPTIRYKRSSLNSYENKY
jgi:hypothetical protein